MATIAINNEQKDYKSIEEILDDIRDSSWKIRQSYTDTSEYGIYKIFFEVMENYVQKESPGKAHQGTARNEFIDLAVKTLNTLGENATFQDDYKIKIYKEVKP